MILEWPIYVWWHKGSFVTKSIGSSTRRSKTKRALVANSSCNDLSSALQNPCFVPNLTTSRLSSSHNLLRQHASTLSLVSNHLVRHTWLLFWLAH
ncbi:hypothetical protein CKAH01_08172 [Colletotrichum kahawae]|uniref:Uncharacterized protein n=1 Tax=Colletotrichum kahawae TaxID=34407 RepID=A0AAE0CZY8_COLKA|nr:hypothetical protein CKAH01_08172 [Colletotrichum kahawae]